MNLKPYIPAIKSIEDRHTRGSTDKRIKFPINHFSYQWADEQLNLLGTMSDEALAERIGIRPEEVRFMRIKRLIKKYQPETKE